MTDDTAPIGPQQPLTSTSSGRTTSGRRLDPSSDWFWPLINLAGLIAVIVVNALANIIPFNGQSTGDVINQDPIFFQPAGWTFSIWSLIYLLLLVFVVYGLLPLGRDDWRVRRIGPLFLVANVANAVWLVVWHYEQWSLSVAVMVVLLAALSLIYAMLRRSRQRPPETAERLMMWLPFSVYLGWIVVAFVANVSVWRDRTGSDALGVSARWWAVLMILLLLLVVAAMTFWRRDPAFVIVPVWGLLGIMVEQWDRSLLVALVALIAMLVALALAGVASVMAYEQHARETVLPQMQPPKHRSGRWFGKERPEDIEQGNRRDGEPSS